MIKGIERIKLRIYRVTALGNLIPRLPGNYRNLDQSRKCDPKITELLTG